MTPRVRGTSSTPPTWCSAGSPWKQINAEKVAISGDKLQNKFAYRHSGFPGGLRARSLGDELQKHADRVVEKAIIGMLPHNKLSRQVQKKLRVYVGPEHPHTAQQPIPFEIKQVTQ